METQAMQRARIETGTLWTIDPIHSTIEFSIKQMMVVTVHGRFDRFRGRSDSTTIAPATRS
jgi:polyisoprenoid-binding protein YceI